MDHSSTFKRQLFRGLMFLFCVAPFIHVSAQNENVQLNGQIIDGKTREPLEGAVIKIIGTTHQVLSDKKGEFNFITGQRVPVTYIISFVGYATREIKISSYGYQVIELKETNQQLNDVVVVGYGSQRRKDLIGSISKIDPELTKKIPAGSFDAQLQGRAAGVQFTTNTGVPGEAVTIRLRGATSINADNTPLFIIDGVFVNSTSLQSINTGGKSTSPLADINPSDIESVEILKDAEATALYGSRGANGVVIVTTKRGGFNQKTKISLDASHGVAWAPPLWELTSGPEHATLVNEWWINTPNATSTPRTFANRPFRPKDQGGIGTPEEQQTYDRLGEIFRTAQLRNYDLSVSGGTKTTRFYIGGGYTNQESLLKPIGFERGSFKFNLDHRISDRVLIGTSNTITRTLRKQGRAGDGPRGGILQAALHTPTYLSPTNDQGVLVGRAGFDNVSLLIQHYDVNAISLRYIGNTFLEAELFKGLKFKSTWGIDYNNYDESQYWNTFLLEGAQGGWGTSTLTRNSSFINEQTLTYRQKVKLHGFGILLGNTIQDNLFRQTSLEGRGFPNNSFKQISAASQVSGSQSWTRNKLASFFGKIDYNFDDRYLLDFSFRADGSSKFPQNTWGYFPSAGAAWRIKNESFLRNVEVVNDLKLRASYGLTGNQNGIGDFAARGLWSPAGYQDTAGIAPFQLPSNLKWEETSQFNIGLDGSFFDSRVSIELNYYQKYTKDGLLQVEPEAVTGITTPFWSNAAEISNKGFELTLNTINISKKNFTWTTNFNIAQNINKIEKLNTLFPLLYGSRNLIIQQEGSPMYSFNVLKELGVDPQTGDVKYAIDKNTRQIDGSIWPKFFGGITNTFTYKNFDLNVFLSFQYGNKTYNHNRFFGESIGARYDNRVLFASNLNRWQKPGDITDVPRADGVNVNNYMDGGSRWLEDGSFLRLRTLSFGYNLPKSLVQKIRFTNVRFYVVASNLFLLTNYSGPDPESSANSSQNEPGIDLGTPPQPRSVQFGVNVTL